MSNSMFPEKRTRSQITLPDDILRVSDKSPLKDARNALRNNIAAAALSCETPLLADKSDDELLLSPRKCDNPSNLLPSYGLSKRSVSPPPGGDYPKQGLPLEGRELKRLKQDLDTDGSPDVEIKLVGTSRRPTPTHIRTNSEPTGTSLRRSARKYPKPPTLSPPVSSTKGRAQSVPLLPSSYPMPYIDLANPPASPRRARSRSRSPSKEREPKLRIRSATMKQVVVLAAIPDEAGTMMDIDEKLPGLRGNPTEATTREPEEHMNDNSSKAGIEIQGPPENELTIHETVNQRKVNTDALEIANLTGNAVEDNEGKDQTEKEEAANCSGLQADIVKDVPERDTGVENLSREIVTNENVPKHKPIQVVISHGIIDPSSSTAERPTTPEAAQQDIFFTSPLTPLPDTADSSIVDDRYASSTGWGMGPGLHDDKVELFPEVKSTHALRTSESQSRLPRLPLVPSTSLGDSKEKKVREMAPPALPTSKPKALDPSKSSISVTGNKHAASGATNAFSLMMKKSSTVPKPANKNQGKQVASVHKSSKPTASTSKPGPSSLFSLASADKAPPRSNVNIHDEMQVGPRKPTIKGKMRPKEKHPKPKFTPAPDIKSQSSDHEATQIDVERMTSEIKTTHEQSPSVRTRPTSPSLKAGDLSMQDVIGLTSRADSSDVSNQREKYVTVDSEIVISGQDPDKHQVPDVDSPKAPEPRIPTSEKNVTSILVDPIPGPTLGLAAQESLTRNSIDPDIDTNSRALSLLSKSKLPLVKRRNPITVPAASRVTRSVSSRQKQNAMEESSPKIEKTNPRVRQVLKGQGPSKLTDNDSFATEPTLPKSRLSELPTGIKDKPPLPPGSPMRISSPAKTTPKSRMVSHQKPASSPSPFKLARSTSLFSVRERRKSIDMGHGQESKGGSSLSTLSNALEKLRMPAPSRPNTTMGFNRDAGTDGDDDNDHPRSVYNGTSSQQALGLKPASHSLKRASTLQPHALEVIPSSHVTTTTGSKALVQRPLSSFLAGKTGASTSKSLQSGRKPYALNGDGLKPRIFGVGSGGVFGSGARRVAPKASRIPALPSVMGSPVKGGDSSEGGFVISPSLYDSSDPFMVDSLQRGDQASVGVAHLFRQASDTWKRDASRRASMASHLLTHVMGPPATPSRGGIRSSSSTYPSSTSPLGNIAPTRSSTRLASTAQSAIGKIKNDRKGVNEVTPESSVKAAPETLKILKDCIIFVDIRTDDGEEAGSLFMEMLEGVGAKVLTRVGQTCTHIVYKNGLMSTLNRYRLLRDPKPFVVGIGWVVDCVEQRKRVDESAYLIDLDGVNVVGTNKRRRSMLPKMFSREFSDAGSSDAERDQPGDVDTSVDESNSSITMDDHLPPLERARRRKSILVGPRS
ncbi:hypothetical protein BDQ17DRAFT_1343966 [Cyathus striatus]|nr:hypothetical protein BDQ17DRAFT_1343966 [Cyathus striatus]